MRVLGRAAVVALLLIVVAGCGDPGQTWTAATSAGAPTSDGGPPADDDATTEVTFTSQGLDLTGDLRLPDGAGPHPGVVLVHGSGPLGRDGTVPGQLAMTFARPVAVLADMADGLRDAGYAVLTYDKRTCGPFNGCAANDYLRPPDDLTIDAFIADAQAAVEHVRTLPEVRADAIAVAGHSQGASFVPGMLLDDPQLAAGIMLSAPYDPVDTLLARQADTVEEIVAGMVPRPAGVDAEIARLRRLARAVERLRSGGGDDDADLGGATTGFWRSWLRASDGVPQLAQQAEQPLLVLTGGADTNVDAAQTSRWRRVLTDDGDDVVQLDCVSHALNCIGADDPLAVDPAEIDADVDPRVIDAIAGFLDDAVR
jgi:uncharacterized protein